MAHSWTNLLVHVLKIEADLVTFQKRHDSESKSTRPNLLWNRTPQLGRPVIGDRK